MAFPVASQWERFRWVLPPLIIFAITRLISGAFLTIGAREQSATLATSPAYHVNFPTERAPGYLGVVSNWDGQWYRAIAELGYPTSLPMDEGGVVPNEWAFYPGYPMLVRGLMMLTRWEFGLAATLVSLTCSALAVVLLYRMIMLNADRFVATGTVLCLCSFPTAATMQVGYSEGLALLLIVSSILALRARRYGVLGLVMIALALTRPIVLAFAFVIGVHWIVRWRRSRVEPFPTAERWAAAGVAIGAALLTALWPAIAAVTTRDANAFSRTQAAWPANQGATGLWANWPVTAVAERSGALAAIIVLILAIVGYAVSRPAARSWGLELRTWSLAYPVYLLLATRPTPSAARYFMLAIGPLWPLPERSSTSESPLQRHLRWTFLLAIVLAGTVGQYFWVTRVFTIPLSPEVQPYP